MLAQYTEIKFSNNRALNVLMEGEGGRHLVTSIL